MHLNIADHRMEIQQIINFIIYATLKKKSFHQRVVIHDVSINSMEIIILNYFSIWLIYKISGFSIDTF